MKVWSWLWSERTATNGWYLWVTTVIMLQAVTDFLSGL